MSTWFCSIFEINTGVSMPYLSNQNHPSFLSKILRKTVEAKEIIIILSAVSIMILVWALYLIKPTPQEHANAIGAKLDGKIVPLKQVLSPSPEYIDGVVISFTTLNGYLLTIGVLGDVYVYAKFTLINQETSTHSISPNLRGIVG